MDKEGVINYLKDMVEGIRDADSFFVIIGDGDNAAMTFHSEGMPTEDIVSLVEQTLWKVEKEVN